LGQSQELEASRDNSSSDISEEDKSGGDNLSYYKKKRVFKSLILRSYDVSALPRLRVLGNNISGMKKDHLIHILKTLFGKELKDYTLVDLDMSACHSRVPAPMQDNPNSTSTINKMLREPSFWDIQILLYRNRIYFESYPSKIPDSMLKKVRKVGLYISLNGIVLIVMSRSKRI